MDRQVAKSLPLARERPQAKAARTKSDFWLFFNAYGEISYCSNALADLLGRNAADLKGLAVTSILQRLPLTRETPGGNIGMMTMNYVGRRSPLELRLGKDRWLPVYASVSSQQLSKGPAFIVELWPRERSGKRHGPGDGDSSD